MGDAGSQFLPVPPWDHLKDTASWPGAWNRGADTQERSRQVAPAGPRRDSGPTGPVPSGSAASGNHLGMPIRVPQASLAPQLRDRQDTGPLAAERDVPAISQRSPEVIRDMMSLMQEGWQHGRVDDLDDPAGAPTERNDSEDRNGTD